MEMEKIPDYGDLMTLEEWLEYVEIGGFIDYDGFGNLATETEMSDIEVRPSDVIDGKLIISHERFTHIVWFNR